MLASTCSLLRRIAPGVKFLSRVFTALKRLPSTATVPTEIRYCLEVRRELSRQPHAFDIATRFALQSSARLHLVQIAVEVELEHCRRAIPGSTGCGRPRKAKCPQIQLVDKHIYDPNLVVPADIVIQAIGKQQSVPPVFPLHKASHTKSLGSPRRDYHIWCFHTASTPTEPIPRGITNGRCQDNKRN